LIVFQLIPANSSLFTLIDIILSPSQRWQQVIQGLCWIGWIRFWKHGGVCCVFIASSMSSLLCLPARVSCVMCDVREYVLLPPALDPISEKDTFVDIRQWRCLIWLKQAQFLEPCADKSHLSFLIAALSADVLGFTSMQPSVSAMAIWSLWFSRSCVWVSWRRIATGSRVAKCHMLVDICRWQWLMRRLKQAQFLESCVDKSHSSFLVAALLVDVLAGFT
jgi:hypothetical protein